MTDGHPPLFPDPVDPTEERIFAPRKSKRTSSSADSSAAAPSPDAVSTEPAPDETPKKSRTLRQRLLVGSGIVVVFALVAAAVVVGYGWWRWSQVGREDLALADVSEGP